MLQKTEAMVLFDFCFTNRYNSFTNPIFWRESMYDYLVVGAGLFGAVFAQQAKAAGKSVLVIDRRDHIAGNAFTRNVEDIHVHVYGAHIFHTNDQQVWNYVNQFANFNRFTNSPVANYKGQLYSLPFNMLPLTRCGE